MTKPEISPAYHQGEVRERRGERFADYLLREAVQRAAGIANSRAERAAKGTAFQEERQVRRRV